MNRNQGSHTKRCHKSPLRSTGPAAPTTVSDNHAADNPTATEVAGSEWE
jgi:hypothetical protein